MRVSLIQAPYHLGRADVGLGAGVPLLAEAMSDLAKAVRLECEPAGRNEIAASMDVVAALALRVREAFEEGAFPLVLAGNCNSSLGTVTGVGAGGLGVVWLDAHGDFNTPATTRSGFFDGLSLAMLTGEGFDALREGCATVGQEHVVHVGGRDLDHEEELRLDASRIARVRPGEALEPALDELAERTRRVYVHVDLDVLDPSEGRANRFAADGGLTVDDVLHAVDAVADRLPIVAAALTAYEPGCDPERRIPPAAARIARTIVRAGDRAGARS